MAIPSGKKQLKNKQMKKILLIATAFICMQAMAQDSTKNDKSDTIRFGSIVIIKHGKKDGKDGKNKDVDIQMGRKKEDTKKHSNVSTNWWIVDLGFSNYSDKTVYSTAGNYLINKPATTTLGSSDFKLNTGKSVNVNVWVFMQRFSLIKRYVNLKYGLGFELNNYRYKSSAAISYNESGAVPYTNTQTNAPFIFRDSISFSKNKLAADYLTVPFMLNFNTNPNSSKKGLSISAGVSAGYLYSQRNKQISDSRGKQKGKGDYDLERFKFSYVGELGLGPVRLYGSYAPQNMYSRGLDMRPYTIGLRMSNW